MPLQQKRHRFQGSVPSLVPLVEFLGPCHWLLLTLHSISLWIKHRLFCISTTVRISQGSFCYASDIPSSTVFIIAAPVTVLTAGTLASTRADVLLVLQDSWQHWHQHVKLLGMADLGLSPFSNGGDECCICSRVRYLHGAIIHKRQRSRTEPHDLD